MKMEGKISTIVIISLFVFGFFIGYSGLETKEG